MTVQPLLLMMHCVLWHSLPGQGYQFDLSEANKQYPVMIFLALVGTERADYQFAETCNQLCMYMRQVELVTR